ncbi:hypothetical protein ACJJTC_019064 [Scirpophaga incertulas]
MLPRSYYTDQDIRKRQIDTLKIFNERVIEITENKEYKVEFTAENKLLSLTVVLSPEFPNEQPSIFLNPVIPHPWLADNSNQVVGAPGLINYTPHSDLGQIVQAIIRELQRSLPTLMHEDIMREATSHRHVNTTANPLFPELNKLSIEELQEILENTDLQDKLLENNPQIYQLDLETEELMSSIEEIAQDNLSKQQMLDDLKTDVIERISTITQMKINYEELHKKYQKLAEIYDPHRIRDCLKEAAMKADEEAEAIVESFLSGKIPAEAFVAQFSEKRALGQTRRARVERLAHQLTQLDKATT